MDVSVSRHMGLFAVARLAERHGVRVRLRPRSPHGLTALVWLPDSVTEREASLYGARSRTVATQAGFQGRGITGPPSVPLRSIPEVQPANQPANHRHEVIVPVPAATGPAENEPAAATATSDWFRSRPSSAPGGNGNGSGNGTPVPTTATAETAPPAAPPDRRVPSGSDEWSVGKHAAQIIAEPVRGDLTAAGLPTRVPQANLIPGSAGGRAAGSGGTSRPGSGQAQTPAMPPRSPRSPEVARSRLSGFQSGVRRAKGVSPSAPDSGEGTDR